MYICNSLCPLQAAIKTWQHLSEDTTINIYRFAFFSVNVIRMPPDRFLVKVFSGFANHANG